MAGRLRTVAHVVAVPRRGGAVRGAVRVRGDAAMAAAGAWIVRRGGEHWIVGARRIRVEELPGVAGDHLLLAGRPGEREVEVDGARTFGSLPSLERLADAQAGPVVIEAIDHDTIKFGHGAELARCHAVESPKVMRLLQARNHSAHHQAGVIRAFGDRRFAFNDDGLVARCSPLVS